MRTALFALAASMWMFSAAFAPVAAQQGIVIENNGVDNSDSARGADRVNISRASGASSTTDGAGLNNESGRAVRDKNRDRKDRGARNSNGGEAAPAETLDAAPVEGDYQPYAEDGAWVEPVAAPEVLAPDASALDPNLPIQLPNTGVGGSLPLASVVASVLSMLMLVISKRRLT